MQEELQKLLEELKAYNQTPEDQKLIEKMKAQLNAIIPTLHASQMEMSDLLVATVTDRSRPMKVMVERTERVRVVRERIKFCLGNLTLCEKYVNDPNILGPVFLLSETVDAQVSLAEGLLADVRTLTAATQ